MSIRIHCAQSFSTNLERFFGEKIEKRGGVVIPTSTSFESFAVKKRQVFGERIVL